MKRALGQDAAGRSRQIARHIDLLRRQFAADVQASSEITDFLGRFVDDEPTEAVTAVVCATPNTLSAHRRA